MIQPTKLILLAVIAFGAATAVNAQGVLTFESETHDFGTIAEGEKPTHIFRFTNTGDEPVTLTHVQPSCGCTAPSYSTNAVAPTEVGEITIEYNSQGRPGDFNKTISVQAQGTAESFTTLRITGTVTPVNIQNGVAQGGVVFDADLHTFSDLLASVPASHVFRMQNRTERPIRISEARVVNRAGSMINCVQAPCTPRINDERARAEAVAVSYPARLIFPGEIVDLNVSIEQTELALNASGVLDVAIILMTDDENQPTKSLRLRGRVNAENSASVGK